MHVARLNVNRGLSFFSLDQFAEAELCFSKAVHLFAKLKNDALRLNATDGIIMTQIAQGQTAKASKLLAEATRSLESMPELPNFSYLSESFKTRQRAIDARRD